MLDIHKVRKTLLWGIPLNLGMTVVCILLIGHLIVPTLDAMAARAPVLRVAPAAQLAPFVGIACLLVVALGLLRAVPCSERSIRRCERMLVAAVLASVVAMALIPVTSMATSHYLTRWGYSACYALQGNPTLWFTDWVRDPAWCVKGKTVDWVNEQARSPQP
ncbi:hypothetical protein [Paracidovorax konjaci]|uniref:Uncharacterized protein n=1 Tax=Paracidovorax konjaci TaxID=32040 RepID=A0A1I1S4C1_9BURK|nr:hypothetical protein [Paracidovorax konjaci]SFD38643.1 hypothetical protein SAMN04489710_101437 [Paracidovorax konjaci]